MAIVVEKSQPRKSLRADAERDLFEDLFLQHWERVFGVLFRLVGDQDEAQDLALEVFWRLHQRPPKFMHVPNIEGWLYRVATNLGYNALRAQKRRKYYEREAGLLTLNTANESDPVQEAENREKRQKVRAVLALMKPRSAKLLILRHSGLTYGAIAAALKVSPRSVGTLLARAERDFERRYRALEGE
jgi:RNA polymerase sigma-70 factor (ECF subfamily)